ncbi:MAG: hypothetical protein HOK21_00375 [Rhodospirillaceae bacterium]|jgi:hypothetical protein|nr:hypothetical protein [Rhodospirillaceae bacterium]MBT4688208.1 hypothetical protein [Rhodospirillaceae bacterium]MBT5079201.1 hypothetical protein [Rhodospirillaceae bacterium]MBT5522515.1 hypothetical protein [Rhodospirillaceae bacterium]MBT5877578.1 hypothetical protein [Rhodospirillaceae bacterium]
MNIRKLLTTGAIVVGSMVALSGPGALAADHSMGFFVTSVGIGDGGNLGGLAGADAHCLKLATAAGSKGRTWRAYLSTQVTKGRGIAARDRIGQGPWYNAKGDLIASDLDQLHISPNLVKRTAVDENGNVVNGRGDKPNRHDILTGSKDDGTAYFPWEKGDHTCGNWTSNDKGSASLGHHDRHGGGNISWTAAHHSRGCSQDNLKSTGGAGLLYCFAAD